jgi:hypothetical protein
MKYSNDLRIHSDKNHKDLYNDLKAIAFGDFHEIFFVCASLGYKKQKRIPLGKNNDDRFWSSTITPEEYSVYYSMVLNSNAMKLEAVTDDRKIMDEIEEYANGGIQILISECLKDFMLENNRIDRIHAHDLPKEILSYLLTVSEA